ncbi:pilus assembly protein [Marinobacter salinisoli]|uniref:Pilus assembly protein n=1 Tax=Marinobacter salinisoli TaxID=2769486 RepID=A0ABX7MRP3_9GAMM|nr:TadE/TadG family type IV pilus assembly protein [Marinobacter salinisoli]QSP94966.1 pilus assembly protein [Marinobacter salinisoli]
MTATIQHSMRRQRGLAAIEATLVLPLLFLLFFAFAELGRAFYQYHELYGAARNASRYLINVARPGSLGDVVVTDAVRSAATRLIVYGSTAQPADGAESILPGLNENDVQIGVDPVSEQVTVQVNYDWTPIFGNSIPAFYGNPISLSWNMDVNIAMRVL